MIRWALAGYGAGGRVFHAPLMAAAAGMELVAATTTDPVKIQQLADTGVRAVPGLADLVGLGIDGVTITTPAGTHVALAHAALDAGLHVVVDKPFAITGDEAAEVVAHAASVGRVLTVFQNRRWDGDFLTVAQLIAGGTLGEIHRFTSALERFHPSLPTWLTSSGPLDGGGTLVDHGPHLFDQATTLFGPVESVFADFGTFGQYGMAENDMVVLLHHRSGVTSTIIASLAAAVEGPRFKVNGVHGGVLIHGFDVQEEQLFAGLGPATHPDEFGVEPADRRATVVVDGTTTTEQLARGRWDTFYRTVVAAVTTASPVPVDPVDAVHVCRIFDAARDSAANGATIPVAVG